MRIKRIISFCMAAVVTIPIFYNVSILNVYAAKSEGKTVTIEGDLSDPASYEKKLEELLSDESVDGVYILDYSIKNDFTNPNTVVEEEGTGIQGRRAVTTYRYRIVDVKNGSDYKGTNVIAKAYGEPGISVTIAKTVSVGNSYSLSSGLSGKVNAAQVSASVGYNVSKSESISISGSDKAPSTHNGKQVRTMVLNAYPVYASKNFKVQRHKSVGGLNYGWSDYGSGSSKRAYGVYFSKTYNYK